MKKITIPPTAVEVCPAIKGIAGYDMLFFNDPSTINIFTESYRFYSLQGAVGRFRFGDDTAKVRRKDRNLTKRILSYKKKYDIMMITENCSKEEYLWRR